MALYSNVLRRKQSPMQVDTSNMRAVDGAQPAPKPIAMAPGGPAPMVQPPRMPGNVAPLNPPPAVRAVTPGAGMGIDPRPKGPPPALPPPVAPPETAVPGTQNAGAPPPEQTPEARREAIDKMVADFVAGQLGRAGKADTAEEEALIRQRMQTDLGGSLVNQRARAGRAGFGSSGALQAQEGDIKRAAEMDALDEVLGLRRTEDQRSIDNANSAVGVETGMRSAASADELRRFALEALAAEQGLDAPGPPTDLAGQQQAWTEGAIKGGADTNKDGVLSPAEKTAYEGDKVAGHQAWSDFNNSGGDRSTLPVLPGPGNGWEVVFPPGTDREGNPKPGQLFNRSTGEIAIYN